jgi:hypothetical protein
MTNPQPPKPPIDPRPPCTICGSTDHTTGHHSTGAAPTGTDEV